MLSALTHVTGIASAELRIECFSCATLPSIIPYAWGSMIGPSFRGSCAHRCCAILLWIASFSNWWLCLQLIQGKIADMYTVAAATRAFVYKTAAEADAGMANRKDCAAVILYAAEHATRMALDAIQVKHLRSAHVSTSAGQDIGQ